VVIGAESGNPLRNGRAHDAVIEEIVQDCEVQRLAVMLDVLPDVDRDLFAGSLLQHAISLRIRTAAARTYVASVGTACRASGATGSAIRCFGMKNTFATIVGTTALPMTVATR
jgi:hypothetical protein